MGAGGPASIRLVFFHHLPRRGSETQGQRLSLPEEPRSPASIMLTKEAVNYFAGNSCKTSVNVHDVEGCGFQMGSPASWLISGKRGWPVRLSCAMGILLGKLMAVGGLHRCLEGSLGEL